MKKWLVPVSMRGVASSADLNAHKDDAEIHFKLAAGDNITIAEDTDTNTYTVSAAGGGSGGPTAPEPLPLDGTKLKHGHKYTTTITYATTELDMSRVDLEDNASCELWIDVDESVSTMPTIKWPNAYWLDGALYNDPYAHTSPWSVPAIGFRNHYSLRKEGSLVVGRLAYVSPIPE